MCSSKPPKPDPLIGQAALSNAELARDMAVTAHDQLAWEKDRAEKQDPLLEKIVNQQIESGEANAKRAESQWEVYRDLFAPVEARMVEDANQFDSPERKERMAGEAAADITRGYQGALESSQRAMERMGVNPNSGRFRALIQDINLGLARDTAGAMNKARRDTELQGMAMREGTAKFGRNMPGTGLAADAASLAAGNSATDNMATGAGIRNAGMNAAQNWFGGATSANSSAGNLGLGQYQGQLNAWQQANQNSALGAAGLGSLFGQLGSAAITKKLRKGGIIRNYRAFGLGNLASLKRKDPAEEGGGVIRGPGTASSDSIPATIEGLQPVRLSNGEAVLNAEAVELLGDDFVNRINSASLAGLKRKSRNGEHRNVKVFLKEKGHV
jgi:hypothetical protein